MGVVLQFPNKKREVAEETYINAPVVDVSEAVPTDAVAIRIEASLFKEMLDTLAFYQAEHPDDGQRARTTLDRAMQ